MEYKDYYKVLGVDKNASERNKSGLPQIGPQIPPDINPMSPGRTKFKEINQ
jgi:curved DNA-binding protein